MVQKRAPEQQDARSPDALVLDLVEKGVHDQRILDAFTRIPRVDFVPVEFASNAYEDEPIKIGQDQVTTQPSLIGLMVQAPHLTGTEKALEIGAGFGFQTAIRCCSRCSSTSCRATDRPGKIGSTYWPRRQ